MITQLSITVEPNAGSSIYHVCDEVSKLAVFTGHSLVFKFNGVKLTCNPDTSAKDLSNLYFVKSTKGELE